MDTVAIVSEARQHHAECVEHYAIYEENRVARDRLVHQLRVRLLAEDPPRSSYTELAKAVGCSRDLVVWILRKQAPGS